MRLLKSIYILMISLGFVHCIGAQDPSYFTIQKGGELPGSFTTSMSSVIIQSHPMQGNVLEMTQIGDVVSFVYTPDPEFTGSDGFTIQEYGPVPPYARNFVFLVDVVASEVTTHDDFFRFSGDEEVTFDISANDESSASDLSCQIVQVMYGEGEIDSVGMLHYTPGVEDRDYIVYTGVDMYGTAATSTIYLTREGEVPTEDTNHSFVLASGAKEYIFVPSGDYTLVSDVLEQGYLTKIDNYTYAYTANVDGEGEDIVEFESNNVTHTVSVKVLDQYIDDGFVKDDLFFTASNTQIIFDVKENDEISQTVITDYSNGLYHVGDGVFAYTPEENFAGAIEFTYEADNGLVEPEVGVIKIIVGNFSPVSNISYELSAVKNQPRVLEYNVPIGTEFFSIEGYPDHGTLEVFTADESVTLGCETIVQKAFAVYTPNNNYTGGDDFIIKYCASDNNVCENIFINVAIEDTDQESCVCVDDCVWPGDANGDGNINMRDMLVIGGRLGQMGDTRDASPYGEMYPSVAAPVWDVVLPNGINVSHADANGDGIISTNDLDWVSDNYGTVNSLVSQDLFGIKDIPFGFINDTDVEVGEVKTIQIFAGNSVFPAVDMRGIAFSVGLPVGSVELGSLEFNFITDNYFVENAPFVSMVNMNDVGLVHAGGIKTNALGSTGFGVIGELSFIVVENAEGIRPKGRNSNIQPDYITLELFDIVYEGSDGLQYSLPSTSIDIKIKREDNNQVTEVSISPNPTMDQLTVTSLIDNARINSIDVFSLTGELISKNTAIDQGEFTLSTDQWESGMYLLTVTTKNGKSTYKIIKQ